MEGKRFIVTVRNDFELQRKKINTCFDFTFQHSPVNVKIRTVIVAF